MWTHGTGILMLSTTREEGRCGVWVVLLCRAPENACVLGVFKAAALPLFSDDRNASQKVLYMVRSLVTTFVDVGVQISRASMVM